jgi:hypothetical protein
MPSQSKKNAPTQAHLPFTAVFQDTIILKSSEFRQIVMVSSINFGLKSEEEQNAILYSFQGFLNAVPFPIEILIRSRQIDLGEYIANLKKHMFQQPNELIRYQTQEYVDFISRLISIANIMDKKFFVVVPYLKTNVKHGLLTPKHAHLQVSVHEFEAVKVEMQKRVEVVQQGLSSLGLQSVVLTTEQIIELLYSSYNISESMRTKLHDTEELAQTTIEQRVEGQGEGLGTRDSGLGGTGTQVPVQGENAGSQDTPAPQSLGGVGGLGTRVRNDQKPETQDQSPTFTSGVGSQFSPAPTNINRQAPAPTTGSQQPINIPVKQ